jgi:type VI secretion system secreted protein Hcp
MAIDVYLKIETIKGESKDKDHVDWIECKSVSWSVSQPKSATASTSGGHTAERCEHSEISITKLSDLATPILLQACASGKTFSKGTLHFMRADADGKPITYFEIELDNVLIGDVSPAVSEGDILTENLGIKFSKVKWKYTKQDIKGGINGNTTGGWDLATNRLAS